MNPDIKAKWVAALRSGEYNQTRSTLKDRTGYCCLGVLCDIVKSEVGGHWKPDSPDVGVFVIGTEEHVGILPNAVVKVAGLLQDNPMVHGGHLTALNDTMMRSFPEIADLIEKHL